MIRKGINKKNFEYWKNLYINVYSDDEIIAILKAKLICQEQEIERNRERIIKLEKKLTKLTKNKWKK